MDNQEFQEIIDRFNQNYFLIKKSNFLAFLGGAFGFLVAASIVSYQGALSAIKAKGGDHAINKLNEMVKEGEKKIEKNSQIKKEAENKFNELNDLNLIPIGTIVSYGGNLDKIDKTKWMPCDGRELNIDQYPELFAVLSNNWGSKEQNVFNIPDLNGRFLRGVDNGKGRDPEASQRQASAIGGKQGDKVGSVQEYATALPVQGKNGENNNFATNKSGEHHHILGRVEPGYMHHGGSGDPIVPHDAAPGRPDVARTGQTANGYTRKNDDGKHFHTITSGGNLETRPRNAYVQWLIKVK